MPHGQHGSHDVNITYVNVTSSDGHRVEEVHDGDTKEAMDHAKESLEMVWKGLVVLAGIYAFFVTERLISLCRTSRRRRNKVLLIYNLLFVIIIIIFVIVTDMDWTLLQFDLFCVSLFVIF